MVTFYRCSLDHPAEEMILPRLTFCVNSPFRTSDASLDGQGVRWKLSSRHAAAMHVTEGIDLLM